MVKDSSVLFFSPNMKSTYGKGVTVFKAAENDVRENIKSSVEEYAELKGYSLIETSKDKIVNAIMTPNSKGFPDKNSRENKIYEGIISIYTSDFSISTTEATLFNGISDVYGGFTGNKLGGTYQHSKSYWTTMFNNYNGLQGEELFAHAFARYMTSNDNSIEAMKEYFPTAMQTIDEILNTQKGN